MPHFLIDQEKGTLRLARLLIVNVIVLLALCALVIEGIILVYPWMAVGTVTLFALDLLVAWRAPLPRPGSSGKSTRVPKLLWLAAAVFTPAGIVAVYKFIRNPDVLSAAQVLFACVLVWSIWFLVNRLGRGKSRSG